ncbi:leucine-rich repeat transmembrane neuronal protein 2-like [Periplaneta americana]|uniref:leucine-rich repeat transmembrane neuronal protein 2-like n=1 Tax=Periplaneta americana TaxID=6978 RepID=UPI0037E7023C
MTDWKCLLLVTILSTLCDVRELCPTKCRCNGNSCNCSWASLDDIPLEDIDSNSTEFIASNNRLTVLKNGSFTAFRLRKLRVINLDYNHISAVESGTFEGLHSLKILSVSHNVIEDLHYHTFAQTTKLQELRISHNNLASLHPDLLRQTHLLQVFDASNNAIKILPPLLFKHCTLLKEVILNKNKIKHISSQQFLHNPTIKIVNLGKNFIQQLHPETFNYIKDLSYLNLSDNKVLYLETDTFKNNCHLIKVDLSKNRLQTLPVCEENCLENVMLLDICDNPIVEGKNVQRVKQLCESNKMFLVEPCGTTSSEQRNNNNNIFEGQQMAQERAILHGRFRRSYTTGTIGVKMLNESDSTSVIPSFENSGKDINRNNSVISENEPENFTQSFLNSTITISLDESDQNVTVKFIDYDSPLVLRESTVRGIFFISLECTLAGAVVLKRLLFSKEKTESNVVDTIELLPVSEPKTDAENKATQTHSV